jgi:hypothetical protein
MTNLFMILKNNNKKNISKTKLNLRLVTFFWLRDHDVCGTSCYPSWSHQPGSQPRSCSMKEKEKAF